MIVAKVELWPSGDARKAEVLGIVAIANIGKPDAPIDPDMYRYQVELQRPDGSKSGRTLIHWRRRGWLHLVANAFAKLDGRRNA